MLLATMDPEDDWVGMAVVLGADFFESIGVSWWLELVTEKFQGRVILATFERS